jgi:D-alanine-D-alanine ligase
MNTILIIVGALALVAGILIYLQKSGKIKDADGNLIPDVVEDKIQAAALIAFNAAGCEGLARVDFFYSDSGEVVINEINTMPGVTPLSVYPKLIEKSGINYQQLITKLIKTAQTRSASITR